MIAPIAIGCGLFVALIAFLTVRIRRENQQVDDILAPEAEASQHITTITTSFIKQEN